MRTTKRPASQTPQNGASRKRKPRISTPEMQTGKDYQGTTPPPTPTPLKKGKKNELTKKTHHQH